MKSAILAAFVALPPLGLSSSDLSDGPPWKLVATRDSFVININGQSMGSTMLTVVPLPSGFHVTESTRIGTMVEQTTEIILDSQQRLVSVTQTGRMRGQDARIDLKYGGNRVKGSALIPGPDGTKSHDVDSAVPNDVIDDNLLQAVIAVLPWSAEAQYDLPVFSAGRNTLMNVKLIVTGSEAVVLPGGPVAAYKIQMTGGEHDTFFYMSKAAPQRLLKITAAEAPFEIVRAN